MDKDNTISSQINISDEEKRLLKTNNEIINRYIQNISKEEEKEEEESENNFVSNQNSIKLDNEKVDIKKGIQEYNEKADKAAAEVLKRLEKKKKNPEIFYYPEINKKSGEIESIHIDYKKFIELLYSFGFRRFDIEKDFIFIKIENQIIKEVTITQIQDHFIDYLKNLPGKVLSKNIRKDDLIEKIYKSPQSYFNANRLSLLKPEEKIIFNTDNKDKCFIYYKNGFVCCKKDGYELKEYSELENYLWENQILPRDFIKDDSETEGVFEKFIKNICNNDEERVNCISSIIGYELHNFFETKLKALVLTDSKISEEPNGRTGKTLFCKALGQIKPYCEINGKDFDFSNKNKYQKANLDTQIVHLNDLKSNFNFENLNNDITEGISVEKKWLHPFRQRTRLILSTNRTIKIDGDSSKDRAIEFEFADHYSEKLSPENEFPGKYFFSKDKDKWDENDWKQFDKFIISCICNYLKNGLMEPKHINLYKRKLIAETNQDFIDFMNDEFASGNIKLDEAYEKKIIHEKFIENYKENRNDIDQKKFTRFLQKYAKYTPGIDENLIENRSGSIRYFKFSTEKK